MNKYIISLTYKNGQSETICGEYTDEQITNLKNAVHKSFHCEQYGVLAIVDKWGGSNLVRLSELQFARFYKEKSDDKQEAEADATEQTVKKAEDWMKSKQGKRS